MLFCIIPLKAQVGEFIDIRDGNKYPTEVIGGKTWMLRNFDYKVANSYGYENRGLNYSGYGRLYTYEAALNCVPPGWHLPSKEEFEALLTALGQKPDRDGWYNQSTVTMLKSNAFYMLLAGYSSLDDKGKRVYYEVDEFGRYWTSSAANDFNSWRFIISPKNARFDDAKKEICFSIRLVKD